jgi:hypothetical protein
MNKKNKLNFIISIVAILIFFNISIKLSYAQGIPAISNLTAVTSETIEQYAKFEVRFDVSTVATNKFIPYDSSSHTSWTTYFQNFAKNGVTVDMLILPTSQNDWNIAKVIPCFYYQPMEEVGNSNDTKALLPVGQMDFRCRGSFSDIDAYQYKIRAIDAGGTGESGIFTFSVIKPSDSSPTRHGFVKLSQSDKRFFEFSDGTAFLWPLVNEGYGNPFGETNVSGTLYSALAHLRQSISNLGGNGVRFLRWAPTSEGGDQIVPFGGYTKAAWQNSQYLTSSEPDPDSNHFLAFGPTNYYNQQSIPVIKNTDYKVTFRVKLSGTKIFNPQVTSGLTVLQDGQLKICGSINEIATNCKVVMVNPVNSQYNNVAQYNSFWTTYSFIVNSGNNALLSIYLRDGLFDGDSRTGSLLINDIEFQKKLTDGSWSPNLLSRSNSDTFSYIDSRDAAEFDEILKQSELLGVYHKMPLFWKQDYVLAEIDANGNFLSDPYPGAPDPNVFYATAVAVTRWLQEGYERYFAARWSYSTAIHSTEYVNEMGRVQNAYDASAVYAANMKKYMTRPMLISNSLDGYWPPEYWTKINPSNSTERIPNGIYDYSDQHLYANTSGGGAYSSLWQDSVAYVRECTAKFNQYRNFSASVGGITYQIKYDAPIVRGEGGIANSGTEPQMCAVSQETTGTYYHKKVWAHVGTLGSSCDGEWYPWFFQKNDACSGVVYPGTTYDTFKIFASYDKFMKKNQTTGEYENLNNGTHQEIGTDLTGDQQILTQNTINPILRAFGSKDSDLQHPRVLVWVDNKNNTWSGNPTNTVSASETFTIFGMPAGDYTQEIWDTRAGTFTVSSTKITVSATGVDAGKLIFSASTAKDLAFKFYLPEMTCGLAGDIDCSGQVNAIDLSRLILKFGQRNVTTGEDIDKSGQVNAIDLAILLSNFGK